MKRPWGGRKLNMTTGGQGDWRAEHGRPQLSVKTTKLLLCKRFAIFILITMRN